MSMQKAMVERNDVDPPELFIFYYDEDLARELDAVLRKMASSESTIFDWRDRGKILEQVRRNAIQKHLAQERRHAHY